MDEYNDFFPYPQYRPHQKRMLDFAYDVVKKGGIGLINAPTGSGKTSVVSAILAGVKDESRPIIIASRMVSQIEIYCKELDYIRCQKKPNLKYTYIIGKNKSCKRFDDGDKSLLKQCRRLSKNHLKNIINNDDPGYEKLEECFWYANSFIYNGDTEKIELSLELSNKVSQFVTTTVNVSNVKEFSEPCCPYLVMKYALNSSDIIICNYHHLINPIYRHAIFGGYFGSDQIEKMKNSHNSPIVIFDEAHNLPSEIGNLFSTSVNKASIDGVIELFVGTTSSAKSDRERAGVKETDFLSGFNAFLHDPNIKTIIEKEGFTDKSIVRFLRETLIATSKFMKKFNERKKDSTFDPKILVNYICSENDEANEDNLKIKIPFLYRLVGQFEQPQDDNDNITDPEDFEEDLESLTSVLKFLSILIQHDTDKSVIKCFLKKETEEKTNDPQLNLKFIDPQPIMVEIADLCHAVILMSGTLQPPEAYGQILFGEDRNVRSLSMPNAFPKENRRLIITNDCTTVRKKLNENKGINKNNDTIAQYVLEFTKIPGNLAIFCQSYAMVEKCQKILKESQVKNVFTQPRSNEETIVLINDFMALPSRGERGILIGVSGGRLSEGIDYRGDLLIGVMVIGLPLVSWDIIERSKMGYYQEKFGFQKGDFLSYNLPALNKSLQAVGRVIRSENDKGIMILCDRRFLSEKIFNNLPKWMLEEFVETNIAHFHNKCTIPP